MEPISIVLLGAGALAGFAAVKAAKSASNSPGAPWIPPDPPTDPTAGYDIALDPRVDTTHIIGVLPCPSNPSPPAGWAYCTGQQSVTPNLGAFATSILNDPTTYPMGSFVQGLIDGNLVAARVEWHTLQGATGKTGCFRGVNLMTPIAQ